MRGHYEGNASARLDDSGKFAVEYTAVNGAFKNVAKLAAEAPEIVKIDGAEFVRNGEGLHVGPELAAA